MKRLIKLALIPIWVLILLWSVITLNEEMSNASVIGIKKLIKEK